MTDKVLMTEDGYIFVQIGDTAEYTNADQTGVVDDVACEEVDTVRGGTVRFDGLLNVNGHEVGYTYLDAEAQAVHADQLAAIRQALEETR